MVVRRPSFIAGRATEPHRLTIKVGKDDERGILVGDLDGHGGVRRWVLGVGWEGESLAGPRSSWMMYGLWLIG